MKRFLLFVAKAGISLSLLYLALDWGNLGVIGRRFNEIAPQWLVVSVVAMVLQVVLGAMRWRYIARHCGLALPLGTALRLNFIGAFFNQTLPSTIGGDAARIWLLGREGAGWKSTTYSVLIDRAVGLLALALVVIACLPWTLQVVQNPIGRAALLLISAGAVIGASAFLVLGMFGESWGRRWWITRHLAGAGAATYSVFSTPRTLAAVTTLSVIVHLITIATAWCVAQAVASPLSIAEALILIPPVVLIAAVPISIAGWGVRESAMMVAFSYAGLSQTDGVVVSILMGAVMFAVGAAGGLVWIASRGEKRISAPGSREG